MAALKGLVVGLGLLVVGAMILLGWGFYYKSSNPDFKLFSDKPAPADAPAGTPATSHHGFGDVDVILPEGCRLTDLRPDGPRIYLLSDCGHVVVMDAVRGTRLGSIRTRP